MTLITLDQRRQFHRDGFLIVRNVVPPHMVTAALKAINHRLEQSHVVERLSLLRHRTWCPELCDQPVITDLIMRSPALAVFNELIGPVQEVGWSQIPLRFPCYEADQAGYVGAHLDGFTGGDNGIDRTIIHSFTALAVVLLSDVTGPDHGNFMVYPGSHRVAEQYFREHDLDEILARGQPDLPRGDSLQIEGRAGDLVISHYLTSHSGAPNLGAHIRYATISRIFHRDHVRTTPTGPARLDALRDAWLEWSGIEISSR